MIIRHIHKILMPLCMIAAILFNTSCEKFGNSNKKQQTMILFSLGFNNLSSALKSDIEDLVTHSLTRDNSKNNNILIFSHHTSGSSNYSNLVSPVLTHVYKDKNNRVIRDTVLVMDPNTISASAETIREVLEFTLDKFPADRYGMILSSHGTGWAPENYCNYPERYDETPGSDIWSTYGRKERVISAPLMEEPDVKSIGVYNISKSEMAEIDITDLADAIPMKMEYIIFDACFMGGVEVAYELRDRCDKIVFSQTEIMADGMDYKTMLSYLLIPGEADLKGFCGNYYMYYENRTGMQKSATVSLVDCHKLEKLAHVCKDIFETQREEIAALEGDRSIQRYYRSIHESIHGWFFDLESIVSNSSASEEQIDQFKEALDACILYKATTLKFMSSINIVTHSGFSMYLPYKDRNYLNTFYKTLEWNKDTELIK